MHILTEQLVKALRDVRQELWVDYCLHMGRTDTDPRPFESKPHIRIIDDALRLACPPKEQPRAWTEHHYRCAWDEHVFLLACEGLSRKEIAERCGLMNYSPRGTKRCTRFAERLTKAAKYTKLTVEKNGEPVLAMRFREYPDSYYNADGSCNHGYIYEDA